MDGDAAGVGESVSIRRTQTHLLNVELLCEIFLGYRGKVNENKTIPERSISHTHTPTYSSKYKR